MNTKTCPECLSEVPEQAAVCRVCHQRISGKSCPDCGETTRAHARKCPWCGHNFLRGARVASFEAYSANASLLATVLLRGRLIPQEIHLTPEKIVILTWGFLWLSRTDEEIPWEKIAGYHYHSGWFWDNVEIQTRGQKANSIGCLHKSSGPRIKEILEQMKE
jgi:RNA polymerase subunit RPABC4/transcription elongation factor Spt4